MAHFAELDENNKVLRVVVIDNADTSDANGNEVESIGIAFCQKLWGGTWIKTSYNNNTRKTFAGVGYTYDPKNDIFIPEQPFPSWKLDSNNDWQAPTPYPTDGKDYEWNEKTTSWVALK